MRCSHKLLKRLLHLTVGGILPLTAFGQSAPRVAPVPHDPLELPIRQIQTADAPTSRTGALQLLARARKNLALGTAGQPYDLKVRFTVDSLGQTHYDGAWEMEDLYVPGLGRRWTATAASGYTITGIAAGGQTYQDGTSSDAVPLRLLEARGVLFDPLQSPAYADGGAIRTASATFQGATVTCLLLSRSRTIVNPATARGWEETEECIDPQSGLLQMHSEAPGRYAVFDYTNAPQFGGHILPGRVTITEGGRIVSNIKVESLNELPAADAALFAPTDAMKAKGRPVAITSAMKISRVQGQVPAGSAVTLRPVCVFGIVTPAGHLVEAHSLQPSDPNSQFAVEEARKIDFASLAPAGAPPRQHFVFVIEKFVSQ